MDYDLKITGGTIIDGTGSPRYEGDVGIKDGKIVALGTADGDATETIDATGRIVCPGFVDIHTHYDAQIIWDRMTSVSPWHGVTTVVMGNCGFGVAPTRPDHRELIMGTLEKVEGMSMNALKGGLGMDWPFETFPDYLDAIESRGSAINVAALVGHTPVRLYVMGEDATEREATDAEVAEMRQIVNEALEAGALGFATSKSPTHVGYQGRPVPSRAANVDEIIEIARALGETGKGMMQATAGKELWHDELAQIAEENNTKATWTALLGGMLGPGAHTRHLALADDIMKRGVEVYPQVTPRPLYFEFTMKEPFLFEGLKVFKSIASAPDTDAKRKIYEDPEFHQAFKDKMQNIRPAFAESFKKTNISYCPSNPEYEERKLYDVAEELGVDPIDFLLDLSLKNDLLGRFRFPVANHDEEEVEELLTDPNTVLGLSDAGAHASQLCDVGLSTYLLKHWVREKNVFTLEQAIHMLTARPAHVFCITDRGTLAEGVPADVVIFDADTISDSKLRRVNDLPGGEERLIADAFGIDAVIVNGTIIRRDGSDTVDGDGELPGKLLRNGHAA